MDVEALRPVRLEAFALVRQPISQGQWRTVVEAVDQIERELDGAPGAAKPEDVLERYGQPGELTVDSVSRHQGREWLGRLNLWLQQQWPVLGGSGVAPHLVLPSENQWEGACRAGAATPYHFGDTLDGSWARYDATSTFGLGRKGAKSKQPWLNGSSGLGNRWGLAELHGQLFEWCEDGWHPNPVGEGHPEDEQPWSEKDAAPPSDAASTRLTASPAAVCARAVPLPQAPFLVLWPRGSLAARAPGPFALGLLVLPWLMLALRFYRPHACSVRMPP